AEKEAETAEVVRLRDQVSLLSGEKSALTAEVLALKVTITQKDHDISLLDSRATHLESALNDAQATCTKAGTKITSLASERDRLASKLRVGYTVHESEDLHAFRRSYHIQDFCFVSFHKVLCGFSISLLDMMYLHRILDVFCLLEIIFPECCSQIFITVNGFPWEFVEPDSSISGDR
ncbi:hypothetical protein Tco_1317647, partial [Tanacetum coccineum]